MKFRKVSALRGPNVWANFQVLEAWVDLEELKDTSSDALPGFNERLQRWLPSLIEHRCSVGERGGFFERLRRGTYLAHILEHVTLELQALAGCAVGFGRTRMANDDGVYKVAVEYEYEEVGRAALETARELCLAAVQAQPFDVDAAIRQLRDVRTRVQPPTDTLALLEAARRRDIPVQDLDAEGLIQLGHGKHQQRLLHGQTSRQGTLAEVLARDRERTWNLLWSAGVPVPDGALVHSAEEAQSAAKGLGGRVVLRPRHGLRYEARIVEAADPDAVRDAYVDACRKGESVLVEQYAAGAEHRVLVIADRAVAAARRDGSTWVDVTAEMHPEVAARAIDAVRTLGLEVAGIDLVAANLRQPLEEQGGVVVNIEPHPELHRHGPAASEAFLDWLIPQEGNGRIPIVAITGTNGKTTTTRFIAHLLAPLHGPVGMTCTEGIYLGGRRLTAGDCSGPQSARVVLRDSRSGAAVLETARGGILREGLGFDRCDVAVITNIGEGDHLGIQEIDTLEQLAYVKSTLVAATGRTGTAVLNAEDPLVADMARWCKGTVVYFAQYANHPVVKAHLGKGGQAVFVRDNQIVLVQGEQETILMALTEVPLTHGGRIGFQVQNALAAVAAAWSLGLPLDVIRAGARTFAADLEQVPGRFNLLEIHDIKLVVDYGHNASALLALIESLDALPHEKRTIVYSSSGDRRDMDLVRQGQVLGDGFDRVILYEDSRYLRGRPVGGIIGPLREGLAQGKRVMDRLEVIDWQQAAEKALATLQPGELLVVQPDVIDETVAFLRRYLTAGAGREIDLEMALAIPGEAQPSPSMDEEESGRVEVRADHVGRGIFAVTACTAGEVLLRGWGEPAAERCRLSIQVDRDLHIIPDGAMQLLNHSCAPNCGVLIRRDACLIEIHALRPIASGEELTIDYDTFEYEIAHLDGACRCRAPSCRGQVRGYRFLPRAQREAYGSYIAEFLREMEEAVAVSEA